VLLRQPAKLVEGNANAGKRRPLDRRLAGEREGHDFPWSARRRGHRHERLVLRVTDAEREAEASSRMRDLDQDEVVAGYEMRGERLLIEPRRVQRRLLVGEATCDPELGGADRSQAAYDA